MKLNGTIQVVRALTDHAIWSGDLAVRGAWVDLLLRANTEDCVLRLNGELVEVRRGQLAWSQLGLAKAWRCSEEKVRGILGVLVKNDCIEVKTTRRRTLITVVNYDIYQSMLEIQLPKNSATDSGSDSAGEASPEPASGSATGPSRSREIGVKKEDTRAGENGLVPVPSDEEFHAFGAGYAGCLATGSGPMPREFVAERLSAYLGRREFPLRWQRMLVQDWESGWRVWGAKKNGVGFGVKAGQESVGALAMQAENRRKVLVGQLAEHPGNWEAKAYEPDNEEAAMEFRAFGKELREVEATLRSLPWEGVTEWVVRLRREAFGRAYAEHPGNPASAAHDAENCTTGEMDEATALRKEMTR